MRVRILASIVAAWAFAAGGTASATIRITEWMYSGNPGEFVELTNVGAAAIDFTGWSYSDEAATPGGADLSAFGSVAPGESVIFTEAVAATFQTAWSIPTVKVIGGISNNLGRNDAIYIFDAADMLVDVLDFGDEEFPGSIRTQNRSGNPLTLAALGANDPFQWTLATVGDVFGSYNSTSNTTGNPGQFTIIPEPTGLVLAGIALMAVVGRRRS